MRIVNLTKQPLRLHDMRGEPVEIPPDPRHVGLVSVADHRTIADGHGREFSLSVQRVRGVKGMPQAEEDTIYVVPVEVAVALGQERDDIVYVGEEAGVRAGNGQALRITHLRRLAFEGDRTTDA